MRHALLICWSMKKHREQYYELQCLDLLTKTRNKKSFFSLYLKIRETILNYAEKKLIKPLAPISTNLSYSPGKVLSMREAQTSRENDTSEADIFLRDIFLTREEYKDVARLIKESFPLKLQRWIEK